MTTTLAQKPRYELLDGLRGVAALVVIWYHIFEAFAASPYDQMLNHGYLAVDFFFVLSGFVVGNILVAWLLMRYYDKPVRAWLTRRFIR